MITATMPDAPPATCTGLKITVGRQALLQALAVADSVVSPSNSQAWRECVRLRAGDGALEIAGADPASWAATTVPQVVVQRDGELLVPAEVLEGLCELSPAETLTLTADLMAGGLWIEGPNEQYRLPARGTDGWPAMPAADGPPHLAIAGEVLARIAELTAKHAGRQAGTRYALTAVHMEVEDRHLVLVATDGRKLALARGELLAAEGPGHPMLLSAAFVRSLPSIVREQPSVEIWVLPRHAVLRSQTTILATTGLMGEFPPHKALLAGDTPMRPRIGKAALVGGLRRAAILTGQFTRGVRMEFGSNLLTLTARSDAPPEKGPDLFEKGAGTGQIRVPIEYDGPPFKIGFNPRLVLDGLDGLGGEDVTIGIESAQRPAILSGEGYTFVALPMVLAF